jgi:hypothetical protein
MTTKNKSSTAVAAESNATVTVTVVFVDLLRKPITGLTVRLNSSAFKKEVITDENGIAATIDDAKRGDEIRILVKKKSGEYSLKHVARPQRDINIYTVRSPELHLESYTQLSSKEQAEAVLPGIAVGEVMTSARLFGELSPYIGAAEAVDEEGMVTRDFPTKKATTTIDEATGKQKAEISIEHHYKVVKTDTPRHITHSLLGARLNYPVGLGISESLCEAMAKEFGCDVAAIKAVIKTESGGGGYLDNGLPKILFERHRFYALTDPNKDKNKKKSKEAHPYAAFPDICNPRPGGYLGNEGEYVRLLKAAKLDQDAAIKSASWGAFQVLAEYHKDCGFESPTALVDACMKSYDGHVELFRGFLRKPEKKKAIEALKERDWEKFTTYYNGGNWRSQNPNYPDTMKGHYDDYSKSSR